MKTRRSKITATSTKKRRKIRKTYSYIERVLMLLPKLSVKECMLAYDALQRPTPEHVQYIREGLKDGLMRSHYRTIYHDLPVKIVEEPPQYGHWVKGKWRRYNKKTIKKYTGKMTISDKPIPS